MTTNDVCGACGHDDLHLEEAGNGRVGYCGNRDSAASPIGMAIYAD